jgi:hypothetical protein
LLDYPGAEKYQTVLFENIDSKKDTFQSPYVIAIRNSLLFTRVTQNRSLLLKEITKLYYQTPDIFMQEYF